MVDKVLRTPKRWMLEPVAERLTGVSPAALTGIGLLAGLAAAGLAASGRPLAALVLWLLNRLLDGLDGELARAFNRQSDLGGYLDILADFTVYALIPLGLAFADGNPVTYLVLAIMLSVFYVNAGSWLFLSSLLEKRAQGAAARGDVTSVTMPGGLIEGAETVVFFCLFCLFPGALPFLFALFSVLVVVTILQRLVWAQKYLD